MYHKQVVVRAVCRRLNRACGTVHGGNRPMQNQNHKTELASPISHTGIGLASFIATILFGKRCLPIAIYHMSIKIISRGKGKSAVAAAAYRAGEKITNERDGITHDYTRKQGVNWSDIFLPENVPPEYHDRATLWNAVEKIEKASNSQLAREIQVALPKELSYFQNKALVREFLKTNFVEKGMVVDLALHNMKTHNPTLISC